MSLPSHITNIYELLDNDGETSQVTVAPKEKIPVKSAAPVKATSQAKSTQQSATGKTSSPRDSRRGDRQDRPERQDRQQDQTNQDGFQRQGGNRGDRDNGNRTDRDGFQRADRDGFQQRGDGAPRGDRQAGRGGYRGDRADRPPRQPRERREGGFQEQAAPEAEGQQATDGFTRREPRDHEGRGDLRRRGAPSTGFVGNKRFSDRQSGTGRPREEKRGGGGRGNWGSSDGSDEIAAIIEEGKEVVADEQAAAEAEPEKPYVETPEDKARREQAEKEAKQITLSDYMKLRDEKRNASANLSKSVESRRANEGVDAAQQKQWGKFEELKKEKVATPAQDESADDKKEKKTKNTVRLDQVFSIKEQPRRQYDDEGREGGRGGRGGRGRGRGGDRRGGDRTEKRSGPRSQDHSATEGVNFNDPNSFPTLH